MTLPGVIMPFEYVVAVRLPHPCQVWSVPDDASHTAYSVTVAGALTPNVVEFAVIVSFGPKIFAFAIWVVAFAAVASIWVVDHPRKA